MQEIMINIINDFGYIGIFLLITLENVFPPIPSEIILTFGGFAVTSTNLTFLGVVLAATLGSILGAIILYYIGQLLTQEKLEKILDGKLGRFLGFKKSDVKKAIDWFNNRGAISVLIARFIPVIRSLISIPAGISQMNFWIFIFYTSIGSLIWNVVLIYLGFLFGDNWQAISHLFNNFSSIIGKIIMLTLLTIIIFFICKQTSKKKIKVNIKK